MIFLLKSDKVFFIVNFIEVFENCELTIRESEKFTGEYQRWNTFIYFYKHG